MLKYLTLILTLLLYCCFSNVYGQDFLKEEQLVSQSSETRVLEIDDKDYLAVCQIQKDLFLFIEEKDRGKIVNLFALDAKVVSEDGLFAPFDEFNNIENFHLLKAKHKILNFTRVSKDVIILNSLNFILFKEPDSDKRIIDANIFTYVFAKENGAWKIKHLTHVSCMKKNLERKISPSDGQTIIN